MMSKTKYTFHPASTKGLTQEVTLWAYNYPEAKRRILKCIYTGRNINQCLIETETFVPEEKYSLKCTKSVL